MRLGDRSIDLGVRQTGTSFEFLRWLRLETEVLSIALNASNASARFAYDCVGRGAKTKTNAAANRPGMMFLRPGVPS